MTNDLLYLKMQEIEMKHFGSTFDDVFQNMPAGPLKNAADALYMKVVIMEEMIHNLENRVYELENPNPEPEHYFYPLTANSKPFRI